MLQKRKDHGSIDLSLSLLPSISSATCQLLDTGYSSLVAVLPTNEMMVFGGSTVLLGDGSY